MKTTQVRSIIALLITGVFMLITSVLALYPILTEDPIKADTYADFFAKTSGVYTGILGVIIGYYFRGTSEKEINS